ncbi:hypothetical protein [Bradyrhizobium diazoefficiens]|uniref:hypothetical protein n=1 Tax=Bradyrhizobium diazoefficiens TaxID=1355477 RepID=UPI000BE8B5EB|nr:hypothetical protein [Bradyrhizobium diazoefficiens]PDT58718.1 hypothetical protein CO678_26160 [Bradyrhizobium diazoefficiens]
MGDYAGAVAAARAFLSAGFTVVPIQFQNEDPPQKPWPPQASSKPVPWCYFEMIQVDDRLRGVGLPGNQVWLAVGNMFAHVWVPKGYGLPAHLALAGQVVELFRSRTLYNTEPGVALRCWSEQGQGPSVQGGDSKSDDGNWFGAVVVIPFQLFYIK